MMSLLSKEASEFEQNIETVLQLSNLDRGLLDEVISALEKRDSRLLKAGIENARMLAGSTLQHLRDIRQNDSLRPGFQALVNQSIVLLVSYFESGVSQLFRVAVAAALDADPSDHLKNIQLKLTVAELAKLGDELRETLPDLVAECPGISFQDTKSIARTFSEFFDVEIPRDEITNEITVGLAFRHVIVHNGGIVDRQCMKQIEHATPRAFRPQISNGESLSFSTDEIRVLARAMVAYVRRLVSELGEHVSATISKPSEAVNL
jgi:hypothetical protein